jgi:hypothetical protein
MYFVEKSRSQSYITTDSESVGQSVLVSGTHLGQATNFSFSLKFSLDSCGFVIFVAPSLTRGRVCNLLWLLFLASAVLLGSESRGTQKPYFIVPILDSPQPEGPGPRIYIPQEQAGPDIPPGTGLPFCRLLRLAGLRWSSNEVRI